MLKERLDAEPKIHVLCNEEVEDVGGDELLSEIVLKNTKTGEEMVLHADEGRLLRPVRVHRQKTTRDVRRRSGHGGRLHQD